MGEGYGTGNGTAPARGELGGTSEAYLGKDCMDKTPKEQTIKAKKNRYVKFYSTKKFLNGRGKKIKT